MPPIPPARASAHAVVPFDRGSLVLTRAALLMLLLAGCASENAVQDASPDDVEADDNETTPDAEGCGNQTGTRFRVILRQTLFAPYNFDNEPWDWDGDLTSWWDSYGLWVEIIALLASEGTLEPGTLTTLVTEMDPFMETLFGSFVAPDPIAELYWKPDGDTELLHQGGWYTLPEDSNLVPTLELGEFTFKKNATLVIEFYDEDLSFDDYVGSLSFERDMVRDAADCGPVSVVFDAADMDAYDTRINGFSVEVISLEEP